MFGQSQDAKDAGQFSRRSSSSVAQTVARMEWENRQTKKLADAIYRASLASRRSPEVQLMRLDKRLGHNEGAKKERQRLYRAILEDRRF